MRNSTMTSALWGREASSFVTQLSPAQHWNMLTCSCLDPFFKGMRQFLSTNSLLQDSIEPRLDELKLHSSVSICTFVLASKYFCS
jgi:hypothetical protein